MNAQVKIEALLPEVSKGDQQDHKDYCAKRKESLLSDLGAKSAETLSERDQFLFHRNFGLGASEAAAAMGLNPYKTPLDLWLEKTGRKEAEDLSNKLQVRRGISYEDNIARFYAEDHGVKIRRHAIKRMDQLPWIACNPDRMIVGQRKGLEVKTGALTDQWGPDGTDEVPNAYLVQCQQNMLVFGYQEWDLAAELYGFSSADLRYYQVSFNPELASIIAHRLTEFWFKHVIADMPPEPQNGADLESLYPKDNGESVVASSEILSKWKRLQLLKEQIKTLETEAYGPMVGGKRIGGLDFEIKQFIGDNAELLLDPEGKKLCSWKQQTRKSLDSKALEKAHPDIAKQYKTESSFRVLR